MPRKTTYRDAAAVILPRPAPKRAIQNVWDWPGHGFRCRKALEYQRAGSDVSCTLWRVMWRIAQQRRVLIAIRLARCLIASPSPQQFLAELAADLRANQILSQITASAED